MEQKERLLTRTEVEERIGHSCSWIYAMVAKGAFPPPIRLAETTSVRWLESDIDNFIVNQIRRNKELRAGLTATPEQTAARPVGRGKESR